MSNLVQRVERVILGQRLLSRGQKVLVAVSGGVDSMVLLHVLQALARKHRWRLAVAHFNHQLRGRASRDDERFVRQAARALGLPCEVGRGGVRARARGEGVSLEMAGRALRHKFLAEAALLTGSKTLALAHHADDQLELLFLRLLRGAGGKGLGGMAVKSPAPFSRKLALIRPLLQERKEAIVGYAHARGIPFREDDSNRDDTILRNRVRRRLLPAVRRLFGEQALTTMLQSMAITGEEAAFAESAARAWLARPRRRGFERLPVAVQRQCLRLQLEALGVAPAFLLIEQLRLQPEQRASAGAVFLAREAGSGLVRTRAPAVPPHRPERMTLALVSKGKAVFSGVAVAWKFAPQLRRFRRPTPGKNREWFDAGKVGREVILRHWRPGDRFQPIGMQRSVKLQDLFVNARVPPAERRARLVATTAAGELFWVEGLRISECFKVEPTTRRRLCWRWRRAPLKQDAN